MVGAEIDDPVGESLPQAYPRTVERVRTARNRWDGFI
jgi:hypothetical protein